MFWSPILQGNDLPPQYYVETYAKYFPGSEVAFHSGFFDSMDKVSANGSMVYKEVGELIGVSRCITEDIMGESGSESSEPISGLSFLKHRKELERLTKGHELVKLNVNVKLFHQILKAMNWSNVMVKLLHLIAMAQSAEFVYTPAAKKMDLKGTISHFGLESLWCNFMNV